MADIHILALDATRQGGAGVYTARFILALVARGHTITLICHEASDEVKRVAQVVEIPRFNMRQGWGMWRFAYWNQIGHYRRMLRSLQLSTADIVIGSAQPLMVPYQKLFPKRRMVYLPHSLVAPVELRSYGHASNIQRFVAISTYRYLEKRCLKVAATTIRFTQAARDAFYKFYGHKACGKVRILPMPIDSRPLRQTVKVGETMRLLSVGRLIKTKNLGFLIDALYNLRAFDWHLDIVGSGGEEALLKAQVAALQLGARVAFIGHIDNVAPHYERADVFLFPSILENSPVVLLEAMSHSLPTLSFKPDGKRYLGANHEIVTDGKTGLLAEDDENFKSILHDILARRFDLNAVGAAAWAAVAERHTWDAHVAEIENIIEPRSE